DRPRRARGQGRRRPPQADHLVREVAPSVRAGDAAAGGGRRRRRRLRRRSRLGLGGRFVRGSFRVGATPTLVFLPRLFLFVPFFFGFVFAFPGDQRGGGRVVAVQAGELGQARRFEEFGAVAGRGGFHERAPDRPGRRAAEAGRFARLRVADPDRGRVERRVADEPGVGEVLRGAGLARLGRAAHVGVAGAGPLGDHALEQARDFVGLALAEHPVAGVGIGFLDLAVGELDAADRGWLVVDAAAGQRRVAVGHFERRDADRE